MLFEVETLVLYGTHRAKWKMCSMRHCKEIHVVSSAFFNILKNQSAKKLQNDIESQKPAGGMLTVYLQNISPPLTAIWWAQARQMRLGETET